MSESKSVTESESLKLAPLIEADSTGDSPGDTHTYTLTVPFPNLRENLHRVHHAYGHQGARRVARLTADLYYNGIIPTKAIQMAREIQTNCRHCQKFRVEHHPARAQRVLPMPMELYGFSEVQADEWHAVTTTPDGFDRVLLLSCGFTGFVLAAPSKSTWPAQRLFEEIWTLLSRVGQPAVLWVDPDSRFSSSVAHDFATTHGF